jgi:hypothetical protein
LNTLPKKFKSEIFTKPHSALLRTNVNATHYMLRKRKQKSTKKIVTIIDFRLIPKKKHIKINDFDCFLVYKFFKKKYFIVVHQKLYLTE